MSVEIYRGSPGKFDSRTLRRKTLNRWTGRNGVTAFVVFLTEVLFGNQSVKSYQNLAILRTCFTNNQSTIITFAATPVRSVSMTITISINTSIVSITDIHIIVNSIS